MEREVNKHLSPGWSAAISLAIACSAAYLVIMVAAGGRHIPQWHPAAVVLFLALCFVFVTAAVMAWCDNVAALEVEQAMEEAKARGLTDLSRY